MSCSNKQTPRPYVLPDSKSGVFLYGWSHICFQDPILPRITSRLHQLSIPQPKWFVAIIAQYQYACDCDGGGDSILENLQQLVDSQSLEHVSLTLSEEWSNEGSTLTLFAFQNPGYEGEDVDYREKTYGGEYRDEGDAVSYCCAAHHLYDVREAAGGSELSAIDDALEEAFSLWYLSLTDVPSPANHRLCQYETLQLKLPKSFGEGDACLNVTMNPPRSKELLQTQSYNNLWRS